MSAERSDAERSGADPREGLGPVRRLLFGVPMMAGELPVFDPDDPAQAPEEPFPLFLAWLTRAVGEGVREPHAMTLATVDADGVPDLRVVALRDADERGWTFATDAGSPKARQLLGQPHAALGFHWREQARQIRVRGLVERADAETAAADFLSRLPASRAASMVGHQSEVLREPAELPRAFAEALARVETEPDAADPRHAVFTLRASTVEFWQGAQGRGHVRLRYRAERPGTGPWTRERLWP